MTNGEIVFISNSSFLSTDFFVSLSKLFLPERLSGFVFDILTLARFSNLSKFRGAC